MPLIGLDYKGLELRVSCLVWPDPAWIEANHGDVHQVAADAIAPIVAHKGFSKEELRVRAKNVNFGIIYGSGGHDIAVQTGVTVPEAKEMVEAHKSRFPGLHRMIADSVLKMQKDGGLVSVVGMCYPIYWTDNRATNNAMIRKYTNTQVQGPAAQLTIMAQQGVLRWLKSQRPRLRALLVHNEHDAVYIDCPSEEVDEVQAKVTEIMETVPVEKLTNGKSLPVPLKVDSKVGMSRGEMDEKDD